MPSSFNPYNNPLCGYSYRFPKEKIERLKLNNFHLAGKQSEHLKDECKKDEGIFNSNTYVMFHFYYFVKLNDQTNCKTSGSHVIKEEKIELKNCNFTEKHSAKHLRF